ncbi:hypothetical protein [Caenibius sp. WL]|uniref:hypothetical protein n=1 Tax=Caenibius sp. WL TaxID=2872646 RepID=UPI001C98F097|nr:hypothetical protein [Caenibius sp. WL]
MRPQSIVLFDRVFLLSLGLGMINTALSFQDSLAYMQADPATAQAGFGAGFLIFTQAVSFAILLLLWYFIARRASTVAKWILVVLTAIGTLAVLPTLSTLAERGLFTMIVALIITAMQIFALVCLFRADAKAWFKARGQSGANPDIFR